MKIALPELALIVLAGPAGAGKTELELTSVAATGRTVEKSRPQRTPILNADIQPGTFSGPGSKAKSKVKEVDMPQKVREFMTAKPLALQEGTTLVEAAR